jgi:hypothetical protein
MMKGDKINKKFSRNLSSLGEPSKSNHGNNAPYDSTETSKQWPDKYFKRNVKERPTSKDGSYDKVIFERSMTIRDVKMELFMIEGLSGFEEKTIRSKITEIMCRSSRELQDALFEKSLSSELQKTWCELKNFIEEFCTEQGIDSVKKYNDEPWSKYLERLNDWRKLNNQSEEIVLKRIRTQWLSRDLKMIFFSADIKLEIAIQRVHEWESFNHRKLSSKESKSEKEYKPLRNKSLKQKIERIYLA